MTSIVETFIGVYNIKIFMTNFPLRKTFLRANILVLTFRIIIFLNIPHIYILNCCHLKNNRQRLYISKRQIYCYFRFRCFDNRNSLSSARTSGGLLFLVFELDLSYFIVFIKAGAYIQELKLCTLVVALWYNSFSIK